ncbi:MAG: hypothetical protein OXH19_14175 [Chloroflexi bacterium]|nr:hypothetical protein [Chloroflexota bacterium]MCY3589956.1 hypothetical protein [Chloroflexota bacterium]MCY3684603.1 hypothetical protein [Chloroflexota bacterium]MDE2710001.1 hypothetical protein [Chloroflexota bacterium]
MPPQSQTGSAIPAATVSGPSFSIVATKLSIRSPPVATGLGVVALMTSGTGPPSWGPRV